MTPEQPWLAIVILNMLAGLRRRLKIDLNGERGPYGNVIWRFGRRSYVQRSGHGAICDLRIGPLVMWADPRTGKPFHFSIR